MRVGDEYREQGHTHTGQRMCKEEMTHTAQSPGRWRKRLIHESRGIAQCAEVRHAEVVRRRRVHRDAAKLDEELVERVAGREVGDVRLRRDVVEVHRQRRPAAWR